MKTILLALFLIANSAFSAESSVLAEAVKSGQMNVVEAVLRTGVDANDSAALVALTQSKARTRFVILDRLLVHGLILDRNLPTDNGPESFLMMSVVANNLPMVRHAIQRGADVNFKDEAGHTPLCMANNLIHIDIANLLREVGAKEDCF